FGMGTENRKVDAIAIVVCTESRPIAWLYVKAAILCHENPCLFGVRQECPGAAIVPWLCRDWRLQQRSRRFGFDRCSGTKAKAQSSVVPSTHQRVAMAKTSDTGPVTSIT
ncbi:MAG: hypothetical protein ABWY49_02715, partial [Rhizobium sp.]